MKNNPGKKKKQGNGYGDGTFIKTSLVLSKAVLSLGKKGTAPTVSAASEKMLLMLYLKRKFSHLKHKDGKEWVRTDDNKFSLTYKELEAHGIPQAMATRGFDEMLAKGLIKIAHQGGAYDKDKTLYSLVDDYKRWRPGDPPIRTRPKDIKRGYQGKNKNNARQRGALTRTSTGDTPGKDTHVNVGHP
jgi:hypothetical protein